MKNERTFSKCPSVLIVIAPSRSVRSSRVPSARIRSTASVLGWPNGFASPTEIAATAG